MAYQGRRAEKKKNDGTLLGIFGLVGTILVVLVVFLCLGRKTPAPDAPTQPPTLPPPAENPYAERDFTVDKNGYIHCDGALSGIDVSEHQREIDWAAVKEAGIEFAIVRVGYRGYDSGGIHADSHAADNLKGAAEQGLRVGAYFFSQAISPEEAVEEAEFVLKMLKNYEITAPVFFDWEPVSDSEARTAAMTGRLLTDCAQAFCQTISQAGYTAGVYFNQYQAQEMYRLREMTEDTFWLAMYEDAMTFPYAMQFWQYSCEGTVPGIDTTVDLNLWFGAAKET